MKASVVAKIFGWVQFGLQAVGQVATAGMPHGVFSWIALLGSLATAVAVHGAAKTDGTN